ncbi:hypothetical protein B0A48_13070 [Cryoendolithus antarcticus]|uniref:Uncharacterized protein n=1 Tax=Cryoendolithus antarcticus TaxID=1507870 RepID=A0A1V8SND3_9PEZI|nr:hypothetical protein B0A48_13070 [Cryoendolithus antarcticus]
MASTTGQPPTTAALQSLSLFSAANDASGDPDVPVQDEDKKADEQSNADEDESGNSDDDDDDDRSSWYDSNGNELTQSEKDDREFHGDSAIWHRDGNGDICHKHESSFTNDITFDIDSPHDMRQMYDHSTAQELQRFVRDRNLPDPFPAGLTLKYHYIPILVAADKELGFRLMDLPPEMRVLIYVEILILEECSCGCPKLSCDAQMLRASRQVYSEASDILYARNTITCKFMVHTHGSASEPHVCAKVHEKAWPHGTCPLMYVRNDLARLPKDIPSFFQHVQNMEITIDCHGEGDMDYGYGMIKNCLLNLCSVLMENRSLKKLTVHVVNHLTKDTEESKRFLWPLKRLRRLQQFELTGDVNEDVVDEISNLVRAAEPAWPRHNTVLQRGKLMEEACAFFELAAMVEQTRCNCEGYCAASFGGNDKTCDRPLNSRIRDVYEQIQESGDYDDLDPFLEGCFASEADEDALRKRLDSLRCLLQKVQPQRIAESLNEFVAISDLRQAHFPAPDRFALLQGVD